MTHAPAPELQALQRRVQLLQAELQTCQQQAETQFNKAPAVVLRLNAQDRLDFSLL